MKKNNFCWVLIILISLGLFSVASCTLGSPQSEYYNAGAADFSPTGSQFDQYLLFRFDTTASSHAFVLPNAHDIVNNIQSPYSGEVIFFVVSADGANSVTLAGGTNVTVKPNSLTIPANSTITVFCVLDNVTSGSEAVTIY